MKKRIATALLVLVLGAGSTFAGTDTIVPTQRRPGHVTVTQTVINLFNRLFGSWLLESK